jgi:hypothetical protein
MAEKLTEVAAGEPSTQVRQLLCVTSLARLAL